MSPRATLTRIGPRRLSVYSLESRKRERQFFWRPTIPVSSNSFAGESCGWENGNLVDDAPFLEEGPTS